MAGILAPRCPSTLLARDPGSSASAPSRCSGPTWPIPARRASAAAPSTASRASADSGGRCSPRLAPTREHGMGSPPYLIGADADLLQDRRGHALLVQPEKQMVGADLRGAVGGGREGGGGQAGHQPGLLLRAARLGLAGQQRET